MASDVSPELQLAFLNSAWNNAKDGNNTLRAQLEAEQVASLEFIRLGSVGSVGKNSASQSYMGYGPGKITAVQITETWGRLLADYDITKSKIIDAAADSNISLTDFDFDQPVYDLMVKSLMVSGNVPSIPNVRELRLPLENQGIFIA